MSKWTSTLKITQLPKDGQHVLIAIKGQRKAHEAYRRVTCETDRMMPIFYPPLAWVRFVWSDGHYMWLPSEVTHWMPLPEPPKEGKDE